MNDFNNIVIGTRVCDIKYKWGTIVGFDSIEMQVKFDNISNKVFIYDYNGKETKYCDYHFGRTLYFDDYDITTAVKIILPLNLIEAFKLLKEVPFNRNGDNYTIYFDADDNTICTKYLDCNYIGGIKYFTEESIDVFSNYIDNYTITLEDFIKSYNTVFGGKND